MKYYALHILLLISATLIGQQQITLHVIVPHPQDEVYVTGNQEALGDWEPDRVKMTAVSDYERELTVTLEFPAELKFTRGTWETEAVVTKHEDGENIKISGGETPSLYIIDHWTDDQVVGGKIALDYHLHQLTSPTYPNEKRTLQVYLPKHYDSKKKYPVVYTLDGDVLFTPLVQTIDVLQVGAEEDTNVIPECIVVGINNTNRRRDLSPIIDPRADEVLGDYTIASHQFYQSINEEIVPFVDQTYATSGFNAIIGHSDGGHFVTRLYLRDDHSFGAVIALSVNDIGDTFRERLPEALSEVYAKPYFLAYGNKDDEFNLLAPYLQGLGLDGKHLMAKKYNADHGQLPSASLDDGIQFIFSAYKNYDALIDSLYNDRFNYRVFEDEYVNEINRRYDIDAEIGFDVYYLLNAARDRGDVNVFNALLDEVDSTEVLQLQLRFYAANEFNQTERALGYLEQMLLSDDETDKLIFFANLPDQYSTFFLGKLDKPSVFIDFIERAKIKWPEYTLEFNYLIIKTAVDNQLTLPNKDKYLEYLKKNYEENKYFTLDELEKL